ncbi:MAG: glucose-1-phosphate thymidylyltransferase [Archaeoglobus sp.]|nr:glucose-1-phosphate thymidylyltransferase [Archaeoglobus sp.]
MKGVILHGGYGTRLRPLTHTGPKQLIPVANKPISQYVLEDLREAGVEEIAIILGDLYPEKVKEYYGDGSDFGVKITYIPQGEPKGIAQAVGLAKDFVGNDSFVVYLGDNILKGGINRFVEKFNNNSYDSMILLTEVKEPQRFGVAEFDENGKLKRLVEKPKVPPSNYALVGIYFFTPLIFEMIAQLKPSWRGEYEITDAIQMLLEKRFEVGYDFVTGWWKDTGTPEDILEANRLVLDEIKPEIKGTVKEDSCIQGRVFVDEGSVVEKGALVRGPCVIGKNSVIESGVYIGPYTSIGNNVTIKKGEIEGCVIMDDCLIDVNERIVDSLIGPHSQILTNSHTKPKGRRFVLGERSRVEL